MTSDHPADANTGSFIRYGNFIFRYRNFVFPASLITLLVLFPPAFIYKYPALDNCLDIVGLLVGLLGVVLRAAVVGIAYIKRGGRNKRIAADRLVTEGMFAHNRNPLYVGNLLIVAGILLIANNPWFYLFGGVFFVVSYSAMVAAEERFLSAKFGDAYAAYCRRVPRWRFRLEGLRETLTGNRIDWHRIVVKEYSSFGVWVLMNFAVFGYEEYKELVNESLGASAYEVVVSGIGILAAGVMVVVVRYLKKSGRFTPDSA